MDIIVSGTESLINGYGKQSVHDLGSIKAIFPPLNYGGEPSVSTGIGSQLPSSHLSIHRVLTKLSNGIASHGVNYCQLQLLFLWIITGLFPCMVLISFSGRFAIRAPAGPGADEALQQAPS